MSGESNAGAARLVFRDATIVFLLLNEGGTALSRGSSASRGRTRT